MLITFLRWAPLFWLILAILLGIFEAVTVDLVAIWFAAGALAAVLPAMLGAPLWLQLTVFVAVSIVMILFTRPAAVKLLHVKKISTNADRTIGMMGRVTQEIDNISGEGRVLVNGLSWAARSDDGAPIAEGETVLVKQIDGTKVIVERV